MINKLLLNKPKYFKTFSISLLEIFPLLSESNKLKASLNLSSFK